MAPRAKKIKKKRTESLGSRIKVRLDSRTVITIKNLAMFKAWKEKYPNAEIIA
jgi:hypothetical protein